MRSYLGCSLVRKCARGRDGGERLRVLRQSCVQGTPGRCVAQRRVWNGPSFPWLCPRTPTSPAHYRRLRALLLCVTFTVLVSICWHLQSSRAIHGKACKRSALLGPYRNLGAESGPEWCSVDSRTSTSTYVWRRPLRRSAAPRAMGPPPMRQSFWVTSEGIKWPARHFRGRAQIEEKCSSGLSICVVWAQRR